MFEKGITK